MCHILVRNDYNGCLLPQGAMWLRVPGLTAAPPGALRTLTLRPHLQCTPYSSRPRILDAQVHLKDFLQFNILGFIFIATLVGSFIELDKLIHMAHLSITSRHNCISVLDEMTVLYTSKLGAKFL